LSDGVRGLLESCFSAVFMVAEVNSLLEGAVRLQPTLVVVDVALAGGDLPNLVAGLHERAHDAKVLLLSVHDECSVAADALAAGADGMIVKSRIATELLPAVDAILAGGRYVMPSRVNTSGAVAAPARVPASPDPAAGRVPR
jgi:DNA-binding NarL/FixJ family response regulator